MSDIMWVFMAKGDPVYCSAKAEVLDEVLDKLGNESEECDIFRVPILDSPPEVFFCSITLNRDDGELEDINYWFEDPPYEDAYVFVDESAFEMGVYVESVEEAISLTEEQWKKMYPEPSEEWTEGELQPF